MEGVVAAKPVSELKDPPISDFTGSMAALGHSRDYAIIRVTWIVLSPALLIRWYSG